jgi:hypothetical protein
MRIEDIRPGMRLARDLHDPNGHVLIRAGVTITERQIKACKSWGIQEASIAPDESLPPREIQDPKVAAEIRQLVDNQFSLSNIDHPAVQMLRALCLQRALDQSWEQQQCER